MAKEAHGGLSHVGGHRSVETGAFVGQPTLNLSDGLASGQFFGYQRSAGGRRDDWLLII
jgi:hypothetical protein